LIDFLVYTLIVVGIFSLLTLSLNMQYGLTGLLNFGQIGFFAAGAYAVAIAHRQELPIWVGVLMAPVAGALMAWLMSMPVRRLRQEYWALLTLGVSEIFLAVMDNEDWIAGGIIGTRGIPPLFGRQFLLLVFVAGLVVLTLASFERVGRSQFGRILRAIREDETMVATLGRDVFHYQARAMVLGGLVAGIAGAIYAHFASFVDTAPFQLTETFFIWTMLIIGGVGNNYGVVFGAALLQGLFVSTRFFPDLIPLFSQTFSLVRSMIVGGALVIFIILRPDGVFPERKRVYRASG